MLVECYKSTRILEMTTAFAVRNSVGKTLLLLISQLIKKHILKNWNGISMFIQSITCIHLFENPMTMFVLSASYDDLQYLISIFVSI